MVKCLSKRDRSTAFFHKRKTIIRKQRNYISSLKDDNGSWSTNNSQLGSISYHYFLNLFSTEGVSTHHLDNIIIQLLSQLAQVLLDKLYIVEEIKKMLSGN